MTFGSTDGWQSSLVRAAGSGASTPCCWPVAAPRSSSTTSDRPTSFWAPGTPRPRPILLSPKSGRSAVRPSPTPTPSPPERVGALSLPAALEAWGRVDIVINNAGIVGPVKTFAELTDEDVDTVLGVQLLGPFNVLRPAWKVMVDQGYGRILNISSGSMFGQGEACTYPTAKAGMIGMTTNLGLTGPAYGIKVNALLPVGFTRMVEDVPCSGTSFSAGGGRFARVFLGETRGVSSSRLTVEEVRDRFAAAMETTNAATIGNVSDELALYAATLAGR